MEKLAIFDVDFTITNKETLLEFFKFMLKKDKKNIKYLLRVIISGILYGIKVYDDSFEGDKLYIVLTSDTGLCAGYNNNVVMYLNNLVKNYYDERLTNIFYKDAIDKIKELKQKGYKIYLISASPEFYLKEFYAIKEVDMIIGTRFHFNDGKFARKMLGANCKGEEKVKRLMSVLKEKNIRVDFKNSLMFSDSLSDTPLLDLVGNGYLINYKKNHEKYKILKWK